MKNRRTITIILFFVVALALVLQLARSEFVLIQQKNQSATAVLAASAEVLTLPEDEMSARERDFYTIVIDSRDGNSIRVKDQAAATLRLMKKDFEIRDIAHDSSIEPDTGSLIICVRNLGSISDLDTVTDFVERGGKAFFAAGFELDSGYHSIYRKLGINEGSELLATEGVKLVSQVLIKGKGVELGADFIQNIALAASLDNKCRLHVTAFENIPLMWDVPHGNGRFMVFNGTMLNAKRSRGLIAGAVSLLEEDYIYPVLNLEVVFIDDFPAPFPQGIDETIYEKFHRSTPVFFRDVWWPDMLRIMSSYGLKYTGVIIRTYDDQVKPPFAKVNETDSTNLLLYGRELLRNDGELGMHGYNHQSLVTVGDSVEKYSREELGYNIFDDEEAVLSSISAFSEYFKASYKDYEITCYVPPSNVLGEKARKVLKQGLPGLETIASIYYQNQDGGSYEQEFEIAEDGILEFPRLTYGFVRDELIDWAILNGVSTAGVVSHFVHPDDVLDVERNRNRSWDELSRIFSEFFKDIKTNYPWLRTMTMTKAGLEARKMLGARMRTDYKKNEINGYINGHQGEYCFILRTDKKPYVKKNCSIEKIDDGTYMVCAKDLAFSIGLGR